MVSLVSGFYFEMKHIKGKENWVVDEFNRSLQVSHFESMRTCEMNIHEIIKEELQHYYSFHHVMEFLQ